MHIQLVTRIFLLCVGAFFFRQPCKTTTRARLEASSRDEVGLVVGLISAWHRM